MSDFASGGIVPDPKRVALRPGEAIVTRPPAEPLLRWVCVPWLIPRVRQDETTAEKETK